MKLRQNLFPMHSDKLFHQPSVQPVPVCPVDQRSGELRQAADLIRAAEQPFAKGYTVVSRLDGTRAHHQPGNINQKLVRWSVGALDKAKLAVVTEIDKLSHLTSCQPVRVVVDFIIVKVHKELWETRTKIEAKAAGVTNIVLAPKFFIERLGVPVVRLFPFDRY